MKLISLGHRARRCSHPPPIADATTAHDPYVITLSEFRPGATLAAALAAEGWPYMESTNPVGMDNGI